MSLLFSTPVVTNSRYPTRSYVLSTTNATRFYSSTPWLSLSPKQHHILYPTRLSSFSTPHIHRCSATSPLLQDAGATAAMLAGGYGLVLTFDNLTERNVIQQSLSRKLVHILSGLLFAACWPVFSTTLHARYFASLVPFINCLRLLIHGLSLAPNEALIKSVTREGNPEELLKGPLYYAFVLILCSLIFWRESPIGVVAVAMMCAGDGVADIVGRRFGSMKLPYNQQKSWAGSISMLLCGFLISIGMLHYYSTLGYFQLDWAWTTQRVALIAVVATVVESLPVTEVVDDNISVPLVTIAAAWLCFGF